MHLSICNLNIPRHRAYHGHLIPSLSPRVGNLTLEPLGGVGNLTQAAECGEFDPSYTTSEEKMLSDLVDKILRS